MKIEFNPECVRGCVFAGPKGQRCGCLPVLSCKCTRVFVSLSEERGDRSACVRVCVCPCVPAAGLPASRWEGANVFVPRLPGRVKMAPGNAALD